MAHHHEDRKIHLTVQTLSGKYEHAFAEGDTLQFVINATLEHLHIKPQPGEVWELYYGDKLLTPTLTIREAHLPDHAVLMLAPKEGGGGLF